MPESIEKIYGEIGRNFIDTSYNSNFFVCARKYIDPERFSSFMPNCHAMIHRKNPPYSIAELKLIMHHSKERNNDLNEKYNLLELT
jgi:5-methylcytosine-specific restriction protein A